MPAVSNNNEESKRSIGQRESHPLPGISAPVRLEFPPLYLHSVSRTFIPLERFVVCPAGTCSFLILLSKLRALLSLASFLILILLFGFLSLFSSPFVCCLSSSFITSFVGEKQIPIFRKISYNNTITNRTKGNDIRLSVDSIFININAQSSKQNHSIQFEKSNDLNIVNQTFLRFHLHYIDPRYWTSRLISTVRVATVCAITVTNKGCIIVHNRGKKQEQIVSYVRAHPIEDRRMERRQPSRHRRPLLPRGWLPLFQGLESRTSRRFLARASLRFRDGRISRFVYTKPPPTTSSN